MYLQISDPPFIFHGQHVFFTNSVLLFLTDCNVITLSIVYTCLELAGKYCCHFTFIKNVLGNIMKEF